MNNGDIKSRNKSVSEAAAKQGAGGGTAAKQERGDQSFNRKDGQESNESMNLDTKEWKKRIVRFLAAQTVSLLGSSLVQYAVVWYITLSTSSGRMMTVSTVCGFLPQLLISLSAGAWADRYDRKKLAMLSDSLIAAATLAAALLFLSGYRSVWLLFAVLAVRSAGTGVQTPAVNALIPQLVPKEHLMKVNGINSTIQSLIMLLSPALSGVVLSAMSIEATFFIDVITAVIGVGITATISIPRLGETNLCGTGSDSGNTSFGAAGAWRQDIRLGLRYLRENPMLRHLLIFQAAVMVLISPSAFLTPLLVSRTFGPEVWRLTASEMTFSAGAAAGGLLIAAWGGWKNRVHTMAAAAAAYGVLMLALGLAPVFAVYLAANFLIGVTMPCYNAPAAAMIQENAEAAMHGRMFSFMQIVSSCTLPLGMVLFGPLADLFRVQDLFLCAGGLVAACAAAAVRKMKD